MTTAPPESLEAEMRRQIERLEDAITKARQSVLVDVSAMDSDVAALCHKILRAGAAAGRRLEPQMIEMINRLDELAEELRDYQRRIRPQDGQ